MEKLLSIDWVTIIIAALINLVFSAIFFISRLANSWRASIEEQYQQNGDGSLWRHYVNLLLFSLFLAFFIWSDFFASNLSFYFSSMFVFGIYMSTTEILFPSSRQGTKERIIFFERYWFFVSSYFVILIAMALLYGLLGR